MRREQERLDIERQAAEKQRQIEMVKLQNE
jgi:hypothetical protein